MAENILPAWVEVQVHTNSLLTNLQDELLEVLQKIPCVGQLFLRQIRLREATGIQEAGTDYHQLVDMTPQHVFNLRLQSIGQENDAAAPATAL